MMLVSGDGIKLNQQIFNSSQFFFWDNGFTKLGSHQTLYLWCEHSPSKIDQGYLSTAKKSTTLTTISVALKFLDQYVVAIQL